MAAEKRFPETICGLYHRQATASPDRIFCYHKDTQTGAWKPTSWHGAQQDAILLSQGLMSLGVRPQDRVGIISETRLEWSQADIAIVCTGAVTVGVYPTTTPEQCAYILAHAEVEVVFVEDLNQLQKLRQVQDQIPTLSRVIIFEKGEAVSDGPLLSIQELRDLGAQYGDEFPDAYEERWRAVEPTDMAMLVYTSGTTGPPKGVVLSHRNIIRTVDSVNRALPLSPDDLSIVFLPLAHSLQRVAGYTGLSSGARGVFAERIDKIVDHMREFHPTVQAAVPRIYEKIHARIMARVEDAPPVRRKVFDWAFDIGMTVAAKRRRKERIGRVLTAQHVVADRAVFTKIREVFGGNIRFLISGAAPISLNLLEFFDACGLTILEGYGLTETTGPATVNTLSTVKFGTVGRPLDICEVRIADDGEILIRGDNVFSSYYNDPEATAAAFTEDGWFMTGDIGTLDLDGFLTITDRKKELIVTAGGKNVSPANIENLVKEAPLISHCVAHGDRRKFLVALIALDTEELKATAKRLSVGHIEPSALLRHPKIVGEVQLIVDRVNRTLPRYETIKYFHILDDDLSIEDDLLTPTLKLKRRNIQARYRSQLDELYDTPRRLRAERRPPK
ncbi:MAG: long-chain acyl-CoA synthetase [Myxococcota bacterium]